VRVTDWPPLGAAEHAQLVIVPGLLHLLSDPGHVPGLDKVGVDMCGWLASWPGGVCKSGDSPVGITGSMSIEVEGGRAGTLLSGLRVRVHHTV
jgi:hypothetical protein